MRRFLPASATNLRSPGFWALAVVCLCTAFVCGLTLFFPVAALTPRIEQAAAERGLRLAIGELESAFPPALVARRVTLADPSGKLPALPVDRLHLAPAWLKLLTGTVAVKLKGELLGGEISGSVTRRGPFSLHAARLTWQSELPGEGGATLTGELRQATLSGTWPPLPNTAQQLELVLDEVSVAHLLGTPAPLRLGTITLRARGTGNNLRVETLEASGGQLAVTGEGSLLLAEPLGRSPLNLTLKLRPGAGLDPLFTELLTALAPPAADGVSRLRLGGTLFAPQKQ